MYEAVSTAHHVGGQRQQLCKQLCERNTVTSGGLRTHCLHKLSLHSGSALAALWSAVLLLLSEVRPSCSIYGGTHLASDRVVGWLTNTFPLGFKSHVEPNVTVDFFLFFLYKLTSDGMRRKCQVNSKGTGYQLTPSTVVPFNRESLVQQIWATYSGEAHGSSWYCDVNIVFSQNIQL